MARRSRMKLKTLTGESAAPGEVDLSTWPEVDDHALSEPRCELYLRRVQGIRLYLEGANSARIKEMCGFGRAHVYRLLTER